MDLRPLRDAPSPEERDAIDAALGAPAAPPTPLALGAAEALRPQLLSALHAAQSRVGWVSRGALGYIAERLHMPPAEAYGVASFYALFSLTPRAERVAHVCDDVACKARGADALAAALEATLGPAGESTQGIGWHRSPCLGLCDRAPGVLVQCAGATPLEAASVRRGPTSCSKPCVAARCPRSRLR